MNNKNQILVRVFLGGSQGQTRPSFCHARGSLQAEYGSAVRFEAIDTDSMKRSPFRFNPKEFIDWLLGADIILGHMHQGNDCLCWDIEELLEEYKRLRTHIGYTGGAMDPIFLQDKISYLLALDEDDHVPTLRIAMPQLSQNDDILITKEDWRAILR